MTRALAVLLALSCTGCWDWSRFEEEGARDGGVLDAGRCGPCACASDTCIAGRCAAADPVVSIGMGHHFACFVVASGAVYCAGDNEYGQLGIGTVNDGSPLPVEASSSGFDRAGTGGDLYMALLAPDGSASYWGLRPGDALTTSPAAIAASLSRTFDRVAGGGEHVCGIAGTVLSCMGANDQGQLGLGSTASRTSFAELPGEWIDMSAGLAHTCGIQRVGADRQLFCWGDNDRGQLGLGDTVGTTTPQRVGSANDWAEVDAGKDFTCGRRGGQLYCWGNNDSTQLGAAGPVQSTAPGSPISAGGRVIDDAQQIAAGRFGACVLRGDRSMWCWGSNDCGALGEGVFPAPREEPARVSEPGDGARWQQMIVGHHVACATRDNGALYCWGRRGDRLAAQNTSCGTDQPDAGIGPPSPAPERICL